MGNVKYFLGIEIARSDNGLILSQGKYINDMIKDVGLNNAKATPSPLSHGTNLS